MMLSDSDRQHVLAEALRMASWNQVQGPVVPALRQLDACVNVTPRSLPCEVECSGDCKRRRVTNTL